MSSSSTDTRPPPDPQSRTPLNLTVPVERLRSSSQPGQGHVLDHPRTQWRHGGLLSLMRRRARARPTASTKYTPSATTPAFTTRALGEAPAHSAKPFRPTTVLEVDAVQGAEEN